MTSPGSTGQAGIASFRDEKYMLFTSYRRSGEPVATPVWVVLLEDEQLGFWTSSGSGKAKRLRHTSRVALQPCNARGVPRPGTAAIDAAARLVSGAELDPIRRGVKDKYGVAAQITKPLVGLYGKLRGKSIAYADRGVLVTARPGESTAL